MSETFNPETWNAILPSWAKATAQGKIEADPDGFVPAILKELASLNKGGSAAGPAPDQYWLEVVFFIARRDIMRAVAGTAFTAPPPGKRRLMGLLPGKPAPASSHRLNIRILNRPKWKISNYPPGKGAAAAINPGPDSARAAYIRLRGTA